MSLYCSICGQPSGSRFLCPVCTQNKMLEKQYNRETYGTEHPGFWGLVELFKNVFGFIFAVCIWLVSPPTVTENKFWYYTKWVTKSTFWVCTFLYILGTYVS